ncbi:MAG: L-serine ammonia-lyase, iron-sulfur-dependent, subunit alpha [Candidatus Aminicenantes bacterium]
MFISIFNDVLGPVMRGPSSSHTAGSYRIGRICRSLLNEKPKRAVFTFDPRGSYSQVYTQQGVDLALAAGLMNWNITDKRFKSALKQAEKAGIDLHFRVSRLKDSHPNAVRIEMTGENETVMKVEARSVGGGMIEIAGMDEWTVNIDGKSHDYLIEGEIGVEPDLDHIMSSAPVELAARQKDSHRIFVHYRGKALLPEEILNKIRNMPKVHKVRRSGPVFFMKKGEPLFTDAESMVQCAESQGMTLGRTALEYESRLLGLSEEETMQEMIRRYRIMRHAVDEGIKRKDVRMQLIQPTAHKIWEEESRGHLPIGGLHSRAAARAMAALHVSNSMGIVCAAPTGGAAGVIPGLIVTLVEEFDMNEEQAAMCLFAAGAVGVIIALRATFAAEVAGCQVEIGAAGAMGAAAVVEAAGRDPREAVDAAAISLQNAMGSVCDLVQGLCEIPCHTRNAATASSAMICADLICGGYENPVPLDETVDALYSAGRMLPPELRCTSKGGIASAPSARKLPRI